MSRPVKKGQRAGLPPYVSYATFSRFLESLRQGLPSRIDRTVIGWLSPAAQPQLLLALRFLRLTSDSGDATERLEDLVAARGPLQQKLLRETISAAYRHVVGGLNLETATNGQLEERFRKVGASAVTLRKCIAFFVSAMDAAGIAHSSYTAKRGAGRPIGARSGRKGMANQGDKSRPSMTAPDRSEEESPRGDNSLAVLVAKFPAFDETWSDDVKTKWLETFQQLAQLQASRRKA